MALVYFPLAYLCIGLTFNMCFRSALSQKVCYCLVWKIAREILSVQTYLEKTFIRKFVLFGDNLASSPEYYIWDFTYPSLDLIWITLCLFLVPFLTWKRFWFWFLLWVSSIHLKKRNSMSPLPPFMGSDSLTPIPTTCPAHTSPHPHTHDMAPGVTPGVTFDTAGPEESLGRCCPFPKGSRLYSIAVLQ